MSAPPLEILPLRLDPLVEGAYQKMVDAQGDLFRVCQVPASLLRVPEPFDSGLTTFRFLALATLSRPRNVLLTTLEMDWPTQERIRAALGPRLEDPSDAEPPPFDHADREAENEHPQPIGRCPRCGIAIYITGGFCGGCHPERV